MLFYNNKYFHQVLTTKYQVGGINRKECSVFIFVDAVLKCHSTLIYKQILKFNKVFFYHPSPNPPYFKVKFLSNPLILYTRELTPYCK